MSKATEVKRHPSNGGKAAPPPKSAGRKTEHLPPRPDNESAGDARSRVKL